MNWEFIPGQKRHTQDGTELVRLMKSIGHGLKPVLALDVGCGDGIIAHDILVMKKATKVIAIDKSAIAYRMAKKNLEPFIEASKAVVTNLSARKFFSDTANADRFDRLVINPPFFPSGSGIPNKRGADQRARHESSLKMSVWCQGARRLLKTGGELYCVFPTERLAELLAELVKNGVEPKEIWWIKSDKKKRRFFLRAVRNAKPGLKVNFS